jgi:hypothetical protein
LSTILVIEGAATIALAITAFFILPDAHSMRKLLVAGTMLEAFALLAVVLRPAPPGRSTAKDHADATPY